MRDPCGVGGVGDVGDGAGRQGGGGGGREVGSASVRSQRGEEAG